MDAGEASTLSLLVPARTIRAPASLSENARAALEALAARSAMVFPEVRDKVSWRAHIATVDAAMAPFVDVVKALPVALDVETICGVDVYIAARNDLSGDEHAKPHLHLHGGAWIYCGGALVAIPAIMAALHFGGVVYAVDYGMAPDRPFPKGLEDALTVYRAILDRHGPGRLLVSGDSAGGNLAAALMLAARDAGLAPPAALFLNSPVTDLTRGSDTLQTNRGVDVVLGEGVSGAGEIYLGGADPAQPYASLIHGTHAGAFPPTYLRSGTRDLLLSDAVRLHAALRKVGVEADLYIGEAMPHGGFALAGAETPEDIAAREDTLRWLARYWR